MNTSETAPASPGTYTPGYGRLKLCMAAYGLALAIFGLAHISTPLRLLAFGKSANAEAVYVIKSKKGLPDILLRNDLEVHAQEEPHDRSYVFWNEFRFQTAEGHSVEVRAPVGSLCKPLYKLIDADGLPTTDLVYYDPKNPSIVAFPLIMSTWFASGVLIIAGIVCAIIGSVLYYWSDKPIELPHVTTGREPGH